MKKTLFLVIVAGVMWMGSADVCAVNYYIDATDGSDSYNGRYPSYGGGVNGPWQTIAKINGKNFAPGDTISFKAGEVWYEQLTVPNSGVEGSTVTFNSYGTGDKPLINVSETITGWSVHSGNIYVATVSFDVHQVFLDDEHMILAHHPNDSFLWTDGESEQTEDYYYVYDADHGLTSEQLIGADMNIRTSQWKYDGFKILDYDPATYKFTMTTAVGADSSDNDSYFLANKLWMLDSPGEWYYQSGSLYVWMPDGSHPSSHKVEGTKYQHGIYARDKEHIKIDGLDIRNAGYAGIGLYNTNKFSLTNLDVINIGSMKYYDQWELSGIGIFIYNSSGMSDTAGEVVGNTIRNTFNDGLRSIYGFNNLLVTDNIVENIAMIGADHYFPSRGIGIRTSGGNVTIRENRVDNSSYGGILFTGPNSIVEKNCINNSCAYLADCGGIYTSRTSSSGNEISRNIITNTGNHDILTIGIYLDDRSTGVLVSDNTVSVARLGMHNHNGNNNTFTNNTVYDCKWSACMQEDNIVEDDVCDNVFENNIYFSKINESLVKMSDYREPVFFQDFADHDYNIYSNRDSGKVVSERGSNYPLKYYSLTEWQDGNENGMINEYEFYVSTSGTDWGELTPVASGNFAANKAKKTVLFNLTQGQYVRLIALSEVNEEAWTTMAELNVLYYSPGELTDLNDDGTVNLEDFAILACCWDDDGGCVEPDWCGGSDFDMSGTVDFTDLAYFVENWLWQGDDNGAPEKFSFIWISDTQTYTDEVHGGTWEMFHDMMPWIAAEKNELNIKFAGHIGDVQIMDLYSDARIQNTRNEFNILGDASIPYAISLGNHDGCENVGSGPNITEKYNRFFPLSDYINLSSFGGYFDTPVAGPMDNTYHYFNAGGIDWLVLAVEFGPHDETMPWMENVIASHPNHKIIILYHCWLISDSTIEAEQATVKYGRDNSAIDTWNRIKEYDNVFMILSGHIWGHVRRVETGENGNKVYMLCHDFCGEGDGYLNIIEFDPENDKFMVKSYSPYLNQYKTDSMFEYEYDNLGIFLESTEF